jgi:uncharacterized protein (TIGR03086 family)
MSASPTDLLAVHRRATEEFVARARAIRDDQWHLPTPCTEWDVRPLVDHVVRWNRLVPDLVAGRSVAEMDRPFERDVLGDNPRAAAEASARAASEAFAVSGALERIVHHPQADMPGAQALYQRVFDNVVHAWDLARAIGADERLDPDLVRIVYEFTKPYEQALQASGAFAPKVAVPSDADPQTQLLALLGRRA